MIKILTNETSLVLTLATPMEKLTSNALPAPSRLSKLLRDSSIPALKEPCLEKEG